MSYNQKLGYAIGVVGISYQEFHLLTPNEFLAIAEAKSMEKYNLLDLIGMSVFNAIGCSLGGKKFKGVFEKTIKQLVNKTNVGNKETTQISKQEHKEGFDDLIKSF